jgi:hypothetical protein
VNKSDGKNAEITSRYAQVLNSHILSTLPDKRQDIDLVDVPLRDALKRVLEDSKTPYIIDDDVPNEPKISIKLTNAPLTSILDALTLSNSIGWRAELKRSAPPAEAPKPTVKEDKSASSAAVSGTYYRLATSAERYVTQIHVGKTVTASPNSLQFRTFNIEGPPATASQDILRGAFPPPTPQLRVYRWQSQKRTFTCPRCHNSISILQQPTETKCTKCERHFEDSWKVCPFDGTKRPEAKDKWRFCPICGKSITLETSWSAPTNFLDNYHFDIPTALEIEKVNAGNTYYLPGVADPVEDEDHEHVDSPVSAESSDHMPLPFTQKIPELLLTQ